MDADENRFAHDEVSESTFEREVISSPLPTLVAFGAPWSKPCQLVRSVLSEVESRWAGKLRVLLVNVDDHPDLGMWYDIQSVPTLVFFVGGHVRARIVGTASTEAIINKLRSIGAILPEISNDGKLSEGQK
jgi:thioredoxin-like negative regulator of GroEL